MYKNMLICTDGSDLAQKGVDHGLALAKSLNAKVTLIVGTEPFPVEGTDMGISWAPSQSVYDDYDEAQKKFAGNILSSAKAQADKLGVTAATLHVPNSRASEAILDTARSKACDLIVMASHGRRGISKLILGSQTQEVVAASHVPVLVVR
jgi:nucleotide-binding universal stress UspA family protein